MLNHSSVLSSQLQSNRLWDMSEGSRRALRDFYKLPADRQQGESSTDIGSDTDGSQNGSHSRAQSESQSEPHGETHAHAPNLDNFEQEEDGELTEIRELDRDDLDVEEFVRKLADEQPLASFIATADQIRREEASLASAQRELVNDNYKKLIRAAETLGYLSSQGDLAGVNSLVEPVGRLTEWTEKLN